MSWQRGSNGDGQAGADERERAEQPEGEAARSPRGRVVVPSTSHPPAPPRPGRDSSGVHARPEPELDDESRRRQRTPDERPRRARRNVSPEIAHLRRRKDTPPARPGSMREQTAEYLAQRPRRPEPPVVVDRSLANPTPPPPTQGAATPPPAPAIAVPIRERSSAPPPRSILRAPAVRHAIITAALIVLAAVGYVWLR